MTPGQQKASGEGPGATRHEGHNDRHAGEQETSAYGLWRPVANAACVATCLTPTTVEVADLVGRHLELVLHVDGRGRQKGVHARPLRQAHRLPRHLQVPAGAPGSHAQLTPLTPGSRTCLSPAGAAAHPFHMRTPKLRSVCICLALCRPAVAGMLPPSPVSEGGRAPGRPPCCVVPGLPYFLCSMRILHQPATLYSAPLPAQL